MYKCQLFQVADLLGKKWTIVIIQEVALNGCKGFNAVFNKLKGISPKILSKRLKELEQKGILQKQLISNKTPIRTSYTLTKKGRELQDIITSFKNWNVKYSNEKLNCNEEDCVNCSLY